MQQLNPVESRILRRELAAVRGLIDKGLITGAGDLTAAGQKWITEDYPALIRAARQKGGKGGGEARAEALTRKERVQIATKANKASIRQRRKAAREKEN